MAGQGDRPIPSRDAQERSVLDVLSVNNIFKYFYVFVKQISGITAVTAGNSNDEVGQQIEMHVDHVAETSSAEDVLYELLLKAGFPLTTCVQTVEMAGKPVFSIEDAILV